MASIGPMTSNMLNECIAEIKKPSTKQKISTHVVDPIVKEISTKLQPYFMTHIIVQIIIILILIYVLSQLKNK